MFDNRVTDVEDLLSRLRYREERAPKKENDILWLAANDMTDPYGPTLEEFEIARDMLLPAFRRYLKGNGHADAGDNSLPLSEGAIQQHRWSQVIRSQVLLLCLTESDAIPLDADWDMTVSAYHLSSPQKVNVSP